MTKEEIALHLTLASKIDALGEQSNTFGDKIEDPHEKARHYADEISDVYNTILANILDQQTYEASIED